MSRVIPSNRPHASAGVQSRPAREKKRLLTVHSVRCDSQLSRMLSKAPAAIASRLARILFKKLVALIWGERALGRFLLVRATIRFTPVRYCSGEGG